MMDQYFGHKELYQVVLRAKTPMQFGNRRIEADEPVLYFDDINMSLLTEQNQPVCARGGYENMPRVIWDERSEVQFQMTDGVMSSVGMSILLSANVLSEQDKNPLYISMKEGPLSPVYTYKKEVNGVEIDFPCIELRHRPIGYPTKKIFIFEYSRNAIQKKCYGEWVQVTDGYDNVHDCLALSYDKNLSDPVKKSREFVVDYYYQYEDEALIYSVEKERFNGLFTLEAKFYSKDENEGRNYTNVLYMPKVRIVSNINL